MKSYIWVQTADGSIQQVEEEVAMFCPMICQEVLQAGMGSSKNYAISLPQRVNPATLGLILDYCRFHQVFGRSNKERKTFDEKFVRLDTKKLCELTSAADSLQLRPLVDLTSRALARMIEGKTPEEIRETFNLPDDLTEEEKLEPLRNTTDDPRIRLLNRLYARKRKELRERERLKVVTFTSWLEPLALPYFGPMPITVLCFVENVEVEEEHIDERSVDDLLLFINSGNGDSKGVRATRSKKKNRGRKDLPRESSSKNENGNHKKDSASVTFSPKLEFDDGDIDDELDPAMKEELDREVEDFARRLNSVWPERMQEILSLGQERRFVPISITGTGSLKSYTGLLLFLHQGGFRAITFHAKE
ncbi:SKP1-like protein 21 isoform X2 [Actinidia eriantha]|nr:SKP1-like protein 21 isoform X2 [Actinidia eriantha]